MRELPKQNKNKFIDADNRSIVTKGVKEEE